jgi:hypothetical protein
MLLLEQMSSKSRFVIGHEFRHLSAGNLETMDNIGAVVSQSHVLDKFLCLLLHPL